jgi:hypothetical protein
VFCHRSVFLPRLIRLARWIRSRPRRTARAAPQHRGTLSLRIEIVLLSYRFRLFRKPSFLPQQDQNRGIQQAAQKGSNVPLQGEKMFHQIKARASTAIVTSALLIILSGCGGGGDAQPTATAASTDATASTTALSEPTRSSFEPVAIEANENAWVESAAANPADPMHRFAMAAKDVGGIQTLNQMMASGQVSELRSVFNKRGIGVTDLRG